VLEGLLRNLLEEVTILDGMRRPSQRFCAGCKGKPLRVVNACEAARGYLEALDAERAAVEAVAAEHGAAH
jgi:hypothetical protein